MNFSRPNAAVNRHNGECRFQGGAMQSRPKVGTLILVIAFLIFAVQTYGQNTPSFFEIWTDGAWLGVSLSDLTKSKSSDLKLTDENGVLVEQVEKDSPAEKGGVQSNDVIVQFNGVKVLTVRQFTRMVGELIPDRTANLVVIRAGAQKTLTVTLGKRPSPDLDGAYSLNLAPLRKNLEDLTERFHGWEGPREPMTFLAGPRPARLGINFDSLTPQLGEYFGVKDAHGVLITSVRKESPAEKAGLKAGDVIVGIDSKEVASAEDVTRMVRAKSEGDLVIKVLRDRQPKTLTVHLEKLDTESRRGRYRLQTIPKSPSTVGSII
jgi:serine protease Do